MKNCILITRDSVCMGDDVMAPHEQEILYSEEETLSTFVEKIKAYVPAMKNVRWDIYCDKTRICFLLSDQTGIYASIIENPNLKMDQLPEKELFCRYIYK